MNAVCFDPIGLIHSPFKDPVGMPIQSIAAQGVPGWIEVDPVYQPGLQDLAGFDYLILLYHLHLIEGANLTVTPFLDDQPRGVFATRSPKRPNPIGLSIVRLVRVDGARVEIEDVDVVDGTPLLDIKPYVPAFDVRATERIGWFAKNIARVAEVRADGRFTDIS
jgi:tRNA-Thr(GGU) m(6)t(6)A37 methyltransferase TsaA